MSRLLLTVVAVALVVVAVKSLPDMARYVKMREM